MTNGFEAMKSSLGDRSVGEVDLSTEIYFKET
jgi:hypothetical protein